MLKMDEPANYKLRTKMHLLQATSKQLAGRLDWG